MDDPLSSLTEYTGKEKNADNEDNDVGPPCLDENTEPRESRDHRYKYAAVERTAQTRTIKSGAGSDTAGELNADCEPSRLQNTSPADSPKFEEPQRSCTSEETKQVERTELDYPLEASVRMKHDEFVGNGTIEYAKTTESHCTSETGGSLEPETEANVVELMKPEITCSQEPVKKNDSFETTSAGNWEIEATSNLVGTQAIQNNTDDVSSAGSKFEKCSSCPFDPHCSNPTGLAAEGLDLGPQTMSSSSTTTSRRATSSMTTTEQSNPTNVATALPPLSIPRRMLLGFLWTIFGLLFFYLVMVGMSTISTNVVMARLPRHGWARTASRQTGAVALLPFAFFLAAPPSSKRSLVLAIQVACALFCHFVITSSDGRVYVDEELFDQMLNREQSHPVLSLVGTSAWRIGGSIGFAASLIIANERVYGPALGRRSPNLPTISAVAAAWIVGVYALYYLDVLVAVLLKDTKELHEILYPVTWILILISSASYRIVERLAEKTAKSHQVSAKKTN